MAASAHLLAAWFVTTAWALLWLALLAGTVAIVVLLRTRWSKAKPWKKCALLSFWVHVLLACLAATIRISASGGPGVGPGDGGPIRVAFLAAATTEDSADQPPPKGADPRPTPEPAAPTPVSSAAAERAPSEKLLSAEEPAAAEPPSPAPSAPAEKDQAPLAAPDLLAPPKFVKPKTKSVKRKSKLGAGAAELAAKVEANGEAARTAEADPRPAGDAALTGAKVVEAEAPAPVAGVADGVAGATGSRTGVPAAYANRFAADRDALVAGGGGNPATEHAVRSALAWLAASQSPDGRWDPKKFGAGREHYVLGQDRGGAGARADAGMTGLALLAFLAAGTPIGTAPTPSKSTADSTTSARLKAPTATSPATPSCSPKCTATRWPPSP